MSATRAMSKGVVMRIVRPVVTHSGDRLPTVRVDHTIPMCIAVACVLCVDLLFHRSLLPRAINPALDEVAHAATGLLFLGALSRWLPRSFVVGGLVGSVVLDVDHLFILFKIHALAPYHGRPYTHSLVTVLLVVLAAFFMRRWRVILVGTAFGLLTHLARDLATGIVPLFWPLSTVQVSVPYDLYVSAVVLLVGQMLCREARQPLQRRG